MVHDLSDALVELVELEGELVTAPPGSHAKAIKEQIASLKMHIAYLIEDLQNGGLESLVK